MGPRGTSASQVQVEAFGRRHRTGLVTLVFTDIVGSTALKQQLGDHAGAQLIEQHHALVRATLQEFPDGEELSTSGDSFFVVFATPSAAVKFALVLQQRLRELSRQAPVPVQDRMGLHLGEVLIQEAQPDRGKDLIGLNVDLGARVMGLAQGGQILLTRAVFDSARQTLKGEEVVGVASLTWLNHGRFELKGVEEPVEICEVRSSEAGVLAAPATSEKARRVEAAEGEAVLGWRPAVGQLVPNTQWVLEAKLGEGGFGEVWLGRHQTMKERRVFKFCFRADRVRSLKREMTLFRLIKERIGDHPNIVSLREVYFGEPPFYIEEDYAEGQDLATWCEAQGGAKRVPLETKLELVAQIADALQAAHDAGVIHRDVKPANILVSGQFSVASSRNPAASDPYSEATRSPMAARHSQLCAKLTDFGIGQVVSEEALKGVTRAGFTKTIIPDSSSSQTGSQMYMAPELFAGKPASTRSDIYSLGVVLYQLLVGDFRQPVTAEWARDISDPLLQADIRQCLAGRPVDRFEGASQLSKRLRSMGQREAELARREAEEAERERLCRQAEHRRRILLVSAGVVGLLLLLATTLAFGLNKARQQRRVAETALQLQRRYAYASDMKAAQVALEQKNRGLAASLLRRYLPKPGEEDLRGLEWRFLWRQSLGEEIRSFPHPPMVVTAALSGDSRFAATVSRDFKVRVWDVASARQLGEFDAGHFQWDIRKAVAFSPDGKWLACPGTQGVTICDTSQWQPIKVFEGTEPPLCFSPDGSCFVAAAANGLLVCVPGSWAGHVLTNVFADCNNLAFSADGTLMAYSPASYVRRAKAPIHLRDMRTGSDLALEDEDESVSLALSADATWLASGNGSGEVCIWNLPSRRPLLRFRPHRTLVAGLAFSADGKLLATGGNDQLIHLWQTGTTNRVRTLEGHLSEIWSLDFAGDETLISASKDGTAKLWSLKPGPPKSHVFEMPEHTWLIGDLPDGSAFVTLNDDRATSLWSLPEGRLLRSNCWQTIEKQLGREVRFFAKNQFAIGISSNGTLHCWDISTQARLRSVELGDGNFVPWVLSPDNRWAFGHTAAEVPVLYDLRSGARSQQFADVQKSYKVAAFSGDSHWLAYSTPDHKLKIWDLVASREKITLAGQAWRILSFGFSPDNKMLASGGIDAQAWIWSVESGKPVQSPLTGHLSGVRFSTFSSDSKTLVTFGDEGTARWWHIATGREMLLFQDLTTVHPLQVSSPEGKPVIKDLVSQEEGGNIRFTLLPTLREIDATLRSNATAGLPRDGL